MSDRVHLRDLLMERSLEVGDVTLASGARSSYYVDARRTTMTARGQLLVGRMGLNRISEQNWRPSHVGGLTLGADPIAYAIAHESAARGTPIDGFTVRKRPKDHGTGRRVEGGLPHAGRVVVVEDTMTTGSSALEAVEVVRAHGPSVVGVLVLVDREEGGGERLREAGLQVVSLFRATELLKRR